MTAASTWATLRSLGTAPSQSPPHAAPAAREPRATGGPPAASTETAPSVVFEQAGKTFATAAGAVRALHGIDLEIRKGEVFGFIGRSGAGKSTLIRLINRLERPTEGRIQVNGQDTADFDEDALVALRRRIGMIFQHFNLMSAKTVAQNVGLPLRMAGVPRARIDEKVRALLELVGLSDKHDAYPAQLSGGQKQRVGIARALVHDPDILLCDEATSALDPETTQSILGLLRDIQARLGITIVLITHEMAVIREVCDRVAVLEKGEIVELGQVWQVFGTPMHEVTRALLGQVSHGMPDDLAERLHPERTAEAQNLVVRLAFSGHDDAPDLLRLSAALGDGGAARLLDSTVNRIQGRTFGRLILGIPAPYADPQALLSRIQSIAPHAQAEVLGYVPGRL